MSDSPHPDHDRGLEFDLATLLTRRRALTLALGAGATAALAACTPGAPGTGQGTTATTTAAAASPPSSATAATGTTMTPSPTVTRAIAECGVEIPDETAGPFPGDGTNGPNALEASGIVRRDITGSFGGGSATRAEGVPLTLTLTLLDNSNGCVPLTGAAVYVWHCDREGRYSMYDAGHEDENFLRGVQEADAYGQVTFTTIFPGAYPGRWPHIHFEVFDSLSNINSTGRVLKVSQAALTEAACNDVYATEAYAASRQNFPGMSLSRDAVFRDDGARYQLATMAGSAAAGYTAALNVTI
ncbi:3,4-dioxygenase subunit beta [Sinomonas mesophila]|uniref:dioxygenase family protein n=1 Tax=Sinomonas mesophila TaxID=1531955 RepID=UPI0009860D6A|nr:3,4-dioxygenase subunit beta [Sinomonas mesophila]